MKIEINIEKRYVIAIIGMIVFVGMVMAWNTANPPVMGHTSGEIRLNALTGEPSLEVWANGVEGSLSAQSSGLNSLISSVSSNYCQANGVNCPSGLVVGGGENGITGTGCASNCAVWGGATCSSTCGGVQCPIGSTARISGTKTVQDVPSNTLVFGSVYICVRD